MKFSVITICLNAGNDLIETVERSLNQTYRNLEIIVKDGMSTDGSISRLPNDSRIRLVREKDSGIYDAMNQAMEYITGDYVIFMNCGDKFYTEDTLQIVADCIEKTPNQMYYGLCYNRKLNHVNAYPREITEFTCFRTMICHQSTIYAAELFKDKRYDVSYLIGADRELLFYLICEKKLHPTYIDEIIVDYQAEGMCEDKKYRKRIAADEKRLQETYFPLGKRIKYRMIHAITLPRLRIWISDSPTLSPIYYRFLKFLYKIIGKKHTAK